MEETGDAGASEHEGEPENMEEPNRPKNPVKRHRPRKQVGDMAYEPYAAPDFYFVVRREPGPGDKLSGALRQASRHIDSLTFNRIAGRGISHLTPFEQDIDWEVVCQQADFEYENADEISTILQSYIINGVSAQFGSSWNVYTKQGVAMKRDVYALLCRQVYAAEIR